MPLTPFQSELAGLLAKQRSPDSYLAGGAALHIEANGKRYSNDLDFFHDSVERTAEAFAQDRQLLEDNAFVVTTDIVQPGYIRTIVSRGDDSTRVEWACDSAWRFLPTIKDDRVGYLLHPIDLAINKLLALVGRDEPRDFLDVLHIHDEVLPLGALCWAASGKDPGFTPLLLLDLLRRRGQYRPEDFAPLRLVEPVDLPQIKRHWLTLLDEIEQFVRSRPPQELGCLYFSPKLDKFIQPSTDEKDILLHFGRPGGILPSIVNSEREGER